MTPSLAPSPPSPLSEEMALKAGTDHGPLDRVRCEIDAIDQKLVALLTERFSCIERASRLKSAPEDAFVAWRVEDVAMKVRQGALSVGFDPDLAEEIWRGMMAHCIAFEEAVLRRSFSVSEDPDSEKRHGAP